MSINFDTWEARGARVSTTSREQYTRLSVNVVTAGLRSVAGGEGERIQLRFGEMWKKYRCRVELRAGDLVTLLALSTW